MFVFHVNVFHHPKEFVVCPAITLRDIEVSPLRAPEGGPPRFTEPLPALFEQVRERLLEIPRMDSEPDGYFLVAGGEAEGDRWQIDGHLFEYNDLMHRCEMHGRCSEATFDQLIRCSGWPNAPCVFELVQEGVTLSEADFRRWAAATET